jgi:hypothetical protein
VVNTEQGEQKGVMPSPIDVELLYEGDESIEELGNLPNLPIVDATPLN